MTAAPAAGLSAAEAARRLAETGPNAVPEAREGWPRALGAKLWTPLAWMLEATVLLELFLGHLTQAGVIAALLIFNAILGVTQEGRAHAAMLALRAKLAVMASVRRDGAWRRIDAAGLVPGDLVKLALGAVVPADIALIDGTVLIDQSMLTGESLPVERKPGETAYAGALVRQGEATGTVTATGPRTYFGKTASLVQEAHSVSGEQRAVLAVVRDLALVNGAIVLAMLADAHARGMSFAEAVPLLLTALLASIPVALPSTFTLAAALSARRLVRAGVLPTRLAAINEAASMSLLCSDKTGTLTENLLAIREVVPLGAADARGDAGAVLGAAAAASSEGGDPVDQAVIAAARDAGAAIPAVTDFLPFDPGRKYAEARLAGGARLRKGAPAALWPGALPEAVAAVGARLAASGHRVLAVAREDATGTAPIGLLGLADPPRADAPGLIAALEGLGVRVVMVTGDAPETAGVIARAVGIRGATCPAEMLATLDAPDDYGVFAGVFPEQKFRLVRLFQRAGQVVGMCGDGTNDAPALRQAQMGIAVATATDVAKAAAGLVLTTPGLSGILDAIREGRAAFARIRTYTLSMVVRKIAFVLYLALGLALTGHAVLTPLLMVLLLIVNDFLTMAITTDRAAASVHPRHWRVGRIILEGGALGVVTLGFVTMLLLIARDWWRLDLAALRTVSFLGLMLAVQANIYVVREERWAWSSAPSAWLAAASLALVAIGVAAAWFGLLMAPLAPARIAVVVAAAVGFLVVLDGLKHGLARIARAPLWSAPRLP